MQTKRWKQHTVGTIPNSNGKKRRIVYTVHVSLDFTSQHLILYYYYSFVSSQGT
jgi:hypothetical protein